MSENYFRVGYSRFTLNNVPESVIKPLVEKGLLEWCAMCKEWHPTQGDDGQVAPQWEEVKRVIEEWKAKETEAIRGLKEEYASKNNQ